MSLATVSQTSAFFQTLDQQTAFQEVHQEVEQVFQAAVTPADSSGPIVLFKLTRMYLIPEKLEPYFFKAVEIKARQAFALAPCQCVEEKETALGVKQIFRSLTETEEERCSEIRQVWVNSTDQRIVYARCYPQDTRYTSLSTSAIVKQEAGIQACWIYRCAVHLNTQAFGVPELPEIEASKQKYVESITALYKALVVKAKELKQEAKTLKRAHTH